MRTPERGKLTFGSNSLENERKLAELILYVVEKCGSHPRFGATKLNKILFWADFYAYGTTGKPLTGVEYMRQRHGPVPKHLVPIRDGLIQSGALDVSSEKLFNGSYKTRFFSKRKADITLFTTEQLELVNEIIDYLRDGTAKEVSDQTHGRAWEILSDGDLIPYEAVFVSDRELVEADIQAIRELGEARGWRERILKRRGSLTEPVQKIG